MKYYLLNIAYVILACIAVMYIHRWSPTNMAGLGWDIFVYFGAVFIGVVLFARSIMKVDKGNRRSYIFFAINTVGLLAVILAVYLAAAR